MPDAPTPEILDEPGTESIVVAKLRAYRDQNSGRATTTLPQTKVVASWPKFLKHGYLMRAQRLAKGDPEKSTALYLISVCKFDGERLTLEEFQEFIPSLDALHLMGEVMGGDDDEGDDNDGRLGNELN